MPIDKNSVERLMKRCQIGVGGRGALDSAHEILAECYGTLGALLDEVERARDTRTDELARNRRTDGLREWHPAGTWLYPGDAIVVVYGDHVQDEEATTESASTAAALWSRDIHDQ